MDWNVDVDDDERFGLPRDRVFETHVCGWRGPSMRAQSEPVPPRELAEVMIPEYEELHAQYLMKGDHIKAVTHEIMLRRFVQVFTGRRVLKSLNPSRSREDFHRWKAFRADQRPATYASLRCTERRFDLLLAQAAGRGYEGRRLAVYAQQGRYLTYFYPMVSGAEIILFFRDGGPLAD